MAITVMSGAARALVMDLEARGIDPAPCLAAAGLARDDVFDPDRRLPVGATERLWRAAGPHIGDPLTAASRLPLGAYRVLDFVCAHSETVGAGLQRIADYFPLVDPRVRFRVDTGAVDGDGTPIVTMAMVTADGSPVPPMSQSFTFAAIVHRSRQFSGIDWPLHRVEMTAVLVPDVATHARFFGCEVRVGAAVPRLVLTRDTFQRPLPTGERELLPLLDQHARLQLASLQITDEPLPGFADAVRTACAEGRPTLDTVARRLGMTARTLQRRLDTVGTSFSAAVDAERERLARRHLSERGLSLAEIAFVLGFSDQAAFTKAFSRWVGQTPNAYRQAHPPVA